MKQGNDVEEIYSKWENKFDKFVFSSKLNMPNYIEMKDNLDQIYDSSSYEMKWEPAAYKNWRYILSSLIKIREGL